MKKITHEYICLAFFCCLILIASSCKKQDDWLNVKRLSSDVTPRTLADFQEILNTDFKMNYTFSTSGLLASDNLFYTDSHFAGLRQLERDGYLWKQSIWDNNGGSSVDWDNMFTVIENANIVLDGIKDINPGTPGYNSVKGQAQFFRSIAYYNLAQVFCKQYDPSTAGTDLGLPLRLTSDVNKLYQRSSLKQTYEQILSDANAAASLLGDQSAFDYRQPYKYSAWGLLAKIYIVMNDYKNAGLYADKVLQKKSALLDFNSELVSIDQAFRFPPDGINNPEILFYASSQEYRSVQPLFSPAYVDTTLYNSYDDNDLRKQCFYISKDNYHQFVGGYTGSFKNFAGIATNELYLIRAECSARQGNTTAAMNDLNMLLGNRYKTGTFTGFTASDANQALKIILQERRKELPFTANIRWEDLRRLNKDPNFQTTVVRNINGSIFTLTPNAPQYAFPIPTDEIQLSGLQQNPY